MTSDPETAVRKMAQHVLAQLAQRDEYESAGGGLLVDSFVPEDRHRPGAEHFKVSFGTRDGWRLVEVEVAPASRDSMANSMAWAAFQIADAFQSEVIELLGDPRPRCAPHAHPMVARVSDAEAWWECPNEPKQRRPLWPG